MFDLASFDSLAPDLHEDPYRIYAALRKQAPAFWSNTEQGWVLLSHQAVSAAFTDSRLLNLDLGEFVRKVSSALGEKPVELLRILDLVLFFRNPPAHGPLRSLVARLMGLKSQASCAAAIEGIAKRLLVPLERDGGMDLVRDYAEPLPPLFMGWFFGLTDQDAGWLAQTLAGVPVVLDRGCSIRDYRRAESQLEEAHAFLRSQIRERLRAPADDGLSLLGSLNSELDQPLDEHGLAALASFVFMAGFETTSALLGSGLWLILRQPELFDQLAANPGLIPSAVEETARLEPPIQQVRRLAQEDQIIAGCPVKAGQSAILMIAAANRDPDAYPNPDQFIPGRVGPPVLSFGAGAHHCLGAWIARMEGRLAIGEVLKKPRPTLCLEKPDWRPHHNQRRMKNLPVQY